eukprot:5652169-Karenia_brevis.AAC.1
MAYKQAELDAVVEHFLGIMPEDSPQGLGSPLVETTQQASMFAMKDKLEQPPKIDIITPDNPQAHAAVSCTHHA